MMRILRDVLIPLFCLIGSTAFAQHKVNEAKIYIPQNAIKMEAGKIIIGKNGDGFQVKAIHSNRRGLFIYKKEVLLSETRMKGWHLYGCTKCPRVFDTYADAELHVWEGHRGFADVRKIR